VSFVYPQYCVCDGEGGVGTPDDSSEEDIIVFFSRYFMIEDPYELLLLKNERNTNKKLKRNNRFIDIGFSVIETCIALTPSGKA
jgi:hypothetical protein